MKTLKIIGLLALGQTAFAAIGVWYMFCPIVLWAYVSAKRENARNQ